MGQLKNSTVAVRKRNIDQVVQALERRIRAHVKVLRSRHVDRRCKQVDQRKRDHRNNEVQQRPSGGGLSASGIATSSGAALWQSAQRLRYSLRGLGVTGTLCRPRGRRRGRSWRGAQARGHSRRDSRLWATGSWSAARTLRQQLRCLRPRLRVRRRLVRLRRRRPVRRHRSLPVARRRPRLRPRRRPPSRTS